MASDALDVPFRELTREVEAHTGVTIADVIALYGPDGYRKLERQALEQIAATTEEGILAVAGGIVSDPGTFAFLLERFHTIWLKASPREHMDRVRSQGDERPMAGNPRAMEDLVALLAGREVLYARAAARVDTSGRALEQSLTDLLGEIGRLPVGAS